MHNYLFYPLLITMLFSCLLAVPSGRAEARTPSLGVEVRIEDFFSPDSFTCGIQEAIDSLPEPGGTVRLAPGDYLLRRAVRIPANVTLRGSGASTVLFRPPEASSTLVAAAARGETVIRVRNAADFDIGSQLTLGVGQGWNSSRGKLITAIEGDRISLDRGLRNDHDVDTVVINYFPGIWARGTGWPPSMSGVVIENLVLDGNITSNPGPESCFTLAAIHFDGVSDSLIRNVKVIGWPSDGIGIQRGSGNRIIGNTIEDCRGHGLHPGTGTRYNVFSGNVVRRNHWCGLYFCANVRGNVISDNIFKENGQHGIGKLGQVFGDKYNVVANNVVIGNGFSGIEANRGGDNLIIGNMTVNNSQSQPGAFPGIQLRRSVTNMTVVGNHCLDDQEEKTQAYGIEESWDSDYNLLVGNHTRGNLRSGLSLDGEHSLKVGNLEPAAD